MFHSSQICVYSNCAKILCGGVEGKYSKILRKDGSPGPFVRGMASEEILICTVLLKYSYISQACGCALCNADGRVAALVMLGKKKTFYFLKKMDRSGDRKQEFRFGATKFSFFLFFLFMV